MNTGYYWDSKQESVMGGRWQWRIGCAGGGAESEAEAIKDLKIMGAQSCVDATNEGGSNEFGHEEATGAQP